MASSWVWGKPSYIKEIESQYDFGHHRNPFIRILVQAKVGNYPYEHAYEHACSQHTSTEETCTELPGCAGAKPWTQPRRCLPLCSSPLPLFAGDLLHLSVLQHHRFPQAGKTLQNTAQLPLHLHPEFVPLHSGFGSAALSGGFCSQNLCIGVLVAMFRLCVEAGRKMQEFPPSLFISLKCVFSH